MSLEALHRERFEIKEYIMNHFDDISDIEEFQLYREGIRGPLRQKIQRLLEEENEHAELDIDSDVFDEEDDFDDEDMDQEWLFDDTKDNKRYRKATAFVELGYVNEAKTIFDELFQKYPNHTYFWPTIMEFYASYFPEFFPHVFNVMESAHKENPEKWEYVFGLCEALNAIVFSADEKELGQIQFDYYKNLARSLSEENPENIEIQKSFYMLQTLDILDGDILLQQKTLERVVRIDSDHNIMYVLDLCEIYISMGDFARAQDMYNIAVRVLPTSPRVQRIGQMYFDVSSGGPALVQKFFDHAKYFKNSRDIPPSYDKEESKRFPSDWAQNN